MAAHPGDAAAPRAQGRAPAPLRCGGTVFEFGSRTFLVGIINMTPDSFAGDGLNGDAGAAEALGRRWKDEGADLLDVGGRSTRPGAAPVPVDEELRRTLPAVRRLVPLGLPVSVDTSSARVAAAALDAGAAMINDVTAFTGDAGMASVVARAGVPAVLMDGRNRREAADVMAEVRLYLAERLRAADAAGIDVSRIVVDPGYGFGVTLGQNMEMLRRLRELTVLGRPILIGTSRKGSIGRILNLPAHDRLEGTAATIVVAIANGADFVRVHDVLAMGRVARMTDAIVRGLPPHLRGRDG
ncbi:MAG TPA: dihydropteroate synthase [bacterium]|nr:dihydropteroate synthase [bacterium]